MRQVAVGARWLPVAGGALLGLLAMLLPSGGAAALGESVEVFPPHVMEGEAFHVNVTAPGLGEPQGVQVHVGCGSCGGGWTSAPLTQWKQVTPGQWRKTLTFPGSAFGGSSGQPKWAQNYTASVVGSTTAKVNATVHLLDDWKQPNGTFQTTGAVRFQVAAPGGELANITLRKWNKNGGLPTVAQLRVAAGEGKAVIDWRIPKEHAADMNCPPAGKCRNYTVEVQVAGRTERAEFQAWPAVLESEVHYLLEGPPGQGLVPLGPGPIAFNRTENVTVALDLQYHNGARLQPSDRTLAGNASLNGTLKLAVERVTVATAPDGNQTVTGIDRVQWLYAAWTPQGWRARWNIPRNLTVTQLGADNPQYRVRLVAQEDRFTNDIPDTNGSAFRVYPLVLQPVLRKSPGGEVERLTNATAVFELRYADGAPFTNTTNRSAMRARLVDDEGDAVHEAALTYKGSGAWAADFRPGIKFRPLGFYKLRLEEGQDADGNEVARTDTEFFEMVPARPRVELRTSVGFEDRNETRGFARGESVAILATIRYADGSPYNRSRLPEGDAVTLTITRVDEGGVEHGSEAIALKALDEEGHWMGNYPIRELDADNPLGPWRWSFHVEDAESPPNVNDTSFVRWVRGAPIRVELLRPPEPLVRAGDVVTLRFLARYTNGTVLHEAYAASGISVQVHPWVQGQAQPAVARLFPVWQEERGDWLAVWMTDRSTLVGDYVFTIQGLDVFGNLLQAHTTRPVTVFVDKLQRQVLREPPEEARRGEVVMVVFDGAEGDLGEPGLEAPRIEVQKWNPVRAAWEKELTDVRLNDSDGPDHVGRFPTGSATSLGLYRFALLGRNDQHAAVHAFSRAFKVLPIEVERAWVGGLDATMQPLVKGTELRLQLAREDGDLVENVGIFRLGDRVANGTALMRPGRFDVLWRTAFTVPDGAYDLVVRGRDVHNNSFSSAPLRIELTGVELQAKVPAPPAAALQRAQRLELRALIQYPDSTHAKTGSFTARFLLGDELFETRELVQNRSAWLLNWTPPAKAPLGRYRVLLSGDDGLGNRVTEQEAFTFQLAEGILKRSFSFQRNIANRTETVLWVLPADGNDTHMRFVLRDDAGARREAAHNLTPSGDYVVRWKPAKDEKLTRYTLEAQGEDSAGNAILAESRSLLLRPAQVGLVFLEQPERSLKPGETGRWVFQLLYSDGTPVPATESNAPLIGMLGPNNKLTEPRPALEAAGPDRWLATWTPVANVHSSIHTLVVGGQDQHGNPVQPGAKSRNFDIDEGFVKEVLGVPGFEAALLPLALLGAAVLLQRRK